MIQGAGNGLILAASAQEIGISSKVLRRLHRDRQIVQLASTVYVDGDTFAAAGPWQQFDLKSRAWTASGRNDGHACDFSAAAVLGFPMWGEPPDLPRVLRPGSAHRGHSRTPHGRIRYGHLPPQHAWSIKESSVTSAAYACVDVMRMGSRLQGLTVADYALALGISRELLSHIASDLHLYKGIDAAAWVLTRADRRSESPLETAGRLACLAYDLPEVVANPWVLGGPVPRRVDLLLPDHGIVLEADGALKYDNRPDASQVIAAQVDRERELRDLEFEVLRFDASLAVARPAQLAGRIRRVIARRNGRTPPDCWTVDAPIGWPSLQLGAGWPVATYASRL